MATTLRTAQDVRPVQPRAGAERNSARRWSGVAVASVAKQPAHLNLLLHDGAVGAPNRRIRVVRYAHWDQYFRTQGDEPRVESQRVGTITIGRGYQQG